MSKKWLHWIFKVLKKIAESTDGIREDTQRAITRLFHHPLCLAMLVMQLAPAGSLKVQLSVIPKLQPRRKR
jgi:hypothetical protein